MLTDSQYQMLASRLLNKVYRNKRLNIKRAISLSNQSKLEMVRYAIKKDAPVLVELVTKDMQPLLRLHGYIFKSQINGNNFYTKTEMKNGKEADRH